MDDLEEVRYPWLNAIEFFTGGYPMEIGAVHLLLGWLFALALIVRVLCRSDVPIAFRLSTIYFALTVFTNPAYTFGGLSLNEVFGVLATIGLLARGRVSSPTVTSPAALGLFIVFFASMTHVLLTTVAYPNLIAEGELFTKIAINVKILVLCANLAVIGWTLRRGEGAEILVRACLWAGVAGLLLYLVQIAIAASGTLPYGTFLDAGFVGVPSFGSVSIERGHFGKFMASYYPFFLFALLKWRWRWQFALLCIVTLINFSASSQVFFACFVVMAVIKFRRRIGIGAVLAGVLVCAGIAALVVNYWSVFQAIGDKIVTIAIEGDESKGGGRSFSVFLDYIRAYPLGMGYSGSTLRTAPGLPEINASYFAFLAQFSFLAVPILGAYLFLVWRTIRHAHRRGVFFHCMAVGIAMSVIIFFTDILWFVPLIWLPFEMVWSVRGAVSRLPGAAADSNERRQGGEQRPAIRPA